MLRLFLHPDADERATIEAWGSVECADVTDADSAAAAARQATADGIERVVAVGGDGTVHLVANGLMQLEPDERPALCVLPMGTGNDLARTLGFDPDEAAETLVTRLHDAELRRADVLRAESGGVTKYIVNALTGGFSGLLHDALTDDQKARWGPFAYLLSAVETLPDLEPFRVVVGWEDGPSETLSVLNLTIANGRTAGGNGPVAPRASLEDGLLDVVFVLDAPGLELARLATRALATHAGGTDYLDDDLVVFNQVQSVRLESEPGLPLIADGEPWCDTPLTVSVVPGALRLAVGPDYVRTPGF